MTLPPRPTFAAALLAALAAPAAGQGPEPLKLDGAFPAGVRTSATESWGTYQVFVSNTGDTAREARVLIFHPGRPDEQYGRDVWVPAHARVTTYVSVGPAPAGSMTIGREIEALLYDRTGGQNRLVLPPGEERVRSRVVGYRKREPTTVIILDPAKDGDDQPAEDAITTAHAMRETGGLPEQMTVVRDPMLPPDAEAFDGVDHVVLAGRILAADPVGRAALRAWLQRGGRLWVMLDRVGPEVVAPLLGDDYAVQVVDRVGLTDVRFHRPGEPEPKSGATFEEPVEMARVALPPGWRVLDLANGWPASFSRRVGRGTVVFTTLDGRAWHRPRTPRDGKSPYGHFPDLPVAHQPLTEIARELALRDEPAALADADLLPLVNEAVGYSVVDRGTVGGVLGAFVLAVLGGSVFLRRTGRGELVGWLAPGAAVLAAGGLAAFGEASRRAVPPSVAVAEVVDAVPGSDAVAEHGLFAVYRPDSGPAPLGSHSGGLLDFDTTGLEGQLRRRIQTDVGTWEWDGLAVPAGVRTGTFRTSARPGRVVAVARLGSDGVEGTLTAPTFHEFEDGLLLAAGRDPLPVRFADDGRFTASGSPLPAGRFVTGAVLNDRQQRRQEVYRKLLTGPLPRHMTDRDLMLAWARPGELPFTVADATRAVGAALLVVPLDLRPPEPGSLVTVPAALVPYRRVQLGRPMVPTTESDFPADQALRFQLPPSVLPLAVERAVLTAKVRAPARKFTVSAGSGPTRVVLAEVDGPTEPVRVVVTDPRALRPDDRGGLTLNLAFGSWDGPHNPWKIESLDLEVVGRAGNTKGRP